MLHADAHAAATSAEHRCVHDALFRGPTVLTHQKRSDRRRLDALASHPALRITFENATLDSDAFSCYTVGAVVARGNAAASGPCSSERTENCAYTCTDVDILTPAQRHLLTARLLPAVAAWFGAALRIREPVGESLAVAAAPPCGFGGHVAIPPQLLADGAASTDLLILLTARPIADHVLAYAAHCQEEHIDFDGRYVPPRPTVGHINIDPQSLTLPPVGSTPQEAEEHIDRILKVWPGATNALQQSNQAGGLSARAAALPPPRSLPFTPSPPLSAPHSSPRRSTA